MLLCPKEKCDAITATSHSEMARAIADLINEHRTDHKVNFKVGYSDDGINLRFGFSPDYVELYEEGKPSSLRFTKKELENIAGPETTAKPPIDFHQEFA